ncbi:MAG TPA: 16S rRNA (uracil(1498)-N(3))-methyltransferase [Ruminococcaceae bacterium]|nr:16S rRNA (uracil(1498)-N(3))-methyltransferase [Oscillospiraceae bacterium]
MAWFFCENEVNSDLITLTGENARHARVLRLRQGEAVTVVTPKGVRCECECKQISADNVTLSVLSKKECENEPDVFVTLYQALPKGDKMDYIVQKCVELGVSRIVPMISARCVSRPDGKSLVKKTARWQKIALQAAMQSRRGIIPEVCPCVSFKQAAEMTKENERTVFFYEMGGDSVKNILKDKPKTIGMFIGSEGGFEEEEARLVTDGGGKAATLGKRILRAETAPLAALSIIMYQTDNFS